MINFIVLFLAFQSQVQPVKDKITIVSKGDTVMYDGYLFENKFMAEFWAKIVSEDKKKDAEIEKVKRDCDILVKIKEQQIVLVENTKIDLQKIIDKKNRDILELNKKVVLPQKIPFYKTFWFGGVVGGVSVGAIFYLVITVVGGTK